VLRIVFFARVREQLGCERLELEWTEALGTLASLEQFLIDQNGPLWAQVLAEENLIRAVNHSVVDTDVSLSSGDEVAFYPPVTGG
jgi:sulfur-carrier protein